MAGQSSGDVLADLTEAAAIQDELAEHRLALEWSKTLLERILRNWMRLESHEAIAYEDKVQSQLNLLGDATASLSHLHKTLGRFGHQLKNHQQHLAHVYPPCGMWYHGPMIDFPIGELLDDSICLIWLERHLHADGFKCPRCGRTERRLFRAQGHFPAYRCRSCEGYYTLLTGTVFEKTRQRPATLVLLLRGMAKGEPTARLARELGVSRKQLQPLRQRLQANLNDTVPTDVMTGTVFEADELYQHAGEKKYAPSRSHRSTPSTRQSAQGARHLRQRSSPHDQHHLA